MGIQINGQTDTISAIDGSLNLTGAELPSVTNLNATGIVTATTISVGSGTSISSPATNILVLGTNNSERVRIDSSGRLGIGTINPTQKLHIQDGPDNIRISGTAVEQNTTSGLTLNGSNASGFIAFRAGGDERSRIISNGNVGIGTTNPNVLLDIFKTSYPEINLKTGTITATFGIDTSFNTFVVGSTTNHPFTLRTNSTDRLYLTSGGNVGINTTTFPANGTNLKVSDGTFSRILLDKTGTNSRSFSVGNGGTYLNVYDETADAERLRIKSDGKIGINNNNPLSTLSVGSRTTDVIDSSLIFTAGGSSSGGEVLAATFCNTAAGASNNATAISFTCRSGDSQTAKIVAMQPSGASSPNTQLDFYVYNNSGSTKIVTFDQDGRVTMPYQPSFAARLTADQTNITGAGVYYTLICNTTTGTTSHNVGSHYSTSTGVFTVPVTGYYYFEAAVTLSTSVYGRAGEFWLSYNNDSIRWFLDRRYFTSVAGTITHMGGSVMIRAVAGDNLRIRGFISGGGQDVSILSSTESSTVSHFAGRLLG